MTQGAENHPQLTLLLHRPANNTWCKHNLGWIPACKLEVLNLQLVFFSLNHLSFMKRSIFRLYELYSKMQNERFCLQSSPQNLRSALAERVLPLSTYRLWWPVYGTTLGDHIVAFFSGWVACTIFNQYLQEQWHRHLIVLSVHLAANRLLPLVWIWREGTIQTLIFTNCKKKVTWDNEIFQPWEHAVICWLKLQPREESYVHRLSPATAGISVAEAGTGAL